MNVNDLINELEMIKDLHEEGGYLAIMIPASTGDYVNIQNVTTEGDQVILD